MAVGRLSTFRRGPFLAAGAARRRCRELIQQFDIRGAHEETPAGSLSGGNQQKVQLARELTRPAKLIIAEQPSQGVDIGAIEAIHRTLVAMRDEGRAVFVVSADLDELLSLSDRILVMYRGRIVGEFAADDANVARIGQLMGGHDSGQAEAVA
jgi:simple sugar transport system ATP-binding protein